MSSDSAAARCFPPSVDHNTRVLLLGSLPGVESLRQQQYYGNPRNQFWRLVGGIIGTDLVSLGYSDRLRQLLAHGIRLWDVIAQAVRPGSLDQNIRDAVPNSLGELVETLPQLRAIGFNGATAFRLGSAQLMHWMQEDAKEMAYISLPSSSPANTMSYTHKAQAWGALAHYLR